MARARFVLFVIGLFALGGGTVGQEKKKDEAKEPAAKAKGQLPQNWAKLGLTDAQKQKVYQIQAKYKEQIESLEYQLREVKEKQRKEQLNVLTEEQKKRLEEILKEKAGTKK
jgi:hypothetical protein